MIKIRSSFLNKNIVWWRLTLRRSLFGFRFELGKGIERVGNYEWYLENGMFCVSPLKICSNLEQKSNKLVHERIGMKPRPLLRTARSSSEMGIFISIHWWVFMSITVCAYICQYHTIIYNRALHSCRLLSYFFFWI